MALCVIGILVAQAPYAFNIQRRLMATYDDTESIKLKTEYALKEKPEWHYVLATCR